MVSSTKQKLVWQGGRGGQTDRGWGFNLPYLLCLEYLPLIWPEPLHPGVGQLDGMDGG